jgi:hypothetical protein
MLRCLEHAAPPAASAPLGRTSRGCSRPTRTWSTRLAGLSRSGPCPCPRSAPAPSSARPTRAPPHALPACALPAYVQQGGPPGGPRLLLRHAEAVVVLEQVDAPVGQLRGVLVLGAQAATVLCAGLRAGVGVEAQLQAWAGAPAASAGAAGREAAAFEVRLSGAPRLCRARSLRARRCPTGSASGCTRWDLTPRACAPPSHLRRASTGDQSRSRRRRALAACREGGLPSMTTYE